MQNTHQSKSKTIFFPGLNALRFFAALGVIITHIELLKGSFGFKNYWSNALFFNLGGLGVYFFFVLSGFLITYLLLEEKKINDTIDIKAFYIRRILRIWPLYYLLCLLGFFILPNLQRIDIDYLTNDFTNHFNTDLILYLLILPNVAFSIYSAVPHIGQLWSIGVEEQFYIVWPLAILNMKKTIKSLIYIIFVLILIKTAVLAIEPLCQNNKLFHALKLLLAMSKFECMAIGGIGAHLLHSKEFPKLLEIVNKRFTFNVTLILIPFLIFFTPTILQNGIHLVFSVLFLIIILNIVSEKKLLLNLEHKFLAYLGKISYGLYMYHLMIIAILFGLFKKYFDACPELLLNVSIYGSTIIITIIVASLSYQFYERPFIKIKSKFSQIKSGEVE